MNDEKKQVPAILRGSSTGTNVLRGRDVRFALSDRNLDPHLVDIIAKIAEVNHTNSLAIAELATMFDQMVDTMQGFSNVAANMKDKIAQFERGAAGELEDEVPSNGSKH